MFMPQHLLHVRQLSQHKAVRKYEQHRTSLNRIVRLLIEPCLVNVLILTPTTLIQEHSGLS